MVRNSFVACAPMGIERVMTAARSSWQSPYCERVIETFCGNDHVIVLGEQQLRRIPPNAPNPPNASPWVEGKLSPSRWWAGCITLVLKPGFSARVYRTMATRIQRGPPSLIHRLLDPGGPRSPEPFDP